MQNGRPGLQLHACRFAFGWGIPGWVMCWVFDTHNTHGVKAGTRMPNTCPGLRLLTFAPPPYYLDGGGQLMGEGQGWGLGHWVLGVGLRSDMSPAAKAEDQDAQALALGLRAHHQWGFYAPGQRLRGKDERQEAQAHVPPITRMKLPCSGKRVRIRGMGHSA